MTDQGRKGDTGRVGDTGRTGDTGDSGRSTPGPPGPPGPAGVAGVSLSLEQLEHYVRRLEGRYRRIARLLTAAVVVTATAALGTLAWTADGLRDRVEGQQAQRREAIIGLCEAQNAQNAKIVRFRKATDPESAKLARETFIQTDCRVEARRLAGKLR